MEQQLEEEEAAAEEMYMDYRLNINSNTEMKLMIRTFGVGSQGEHDILHVDDGGDDAHAEEGADAPRPRDPPEEQLLAL